MPTRPENRPPKRARKTATQTRKDPNKTGGWTQSGANRFSASNSLIIRENTGNCRDFGLLNRSMRVRLKKFGPDRYPQTRRTGRSKISRLIALCGGRRGNWPRLESSAVELASWDRLELDGPSSHGDIAAEGNSLRSNRRISFATHALWVHYFRCSANNHRSSVVRLILQAPPILNPGSAPRLTKR
jgi:hypothetical protein